MSDYQIVFGRPSDNVAPDATTITASAADADYPAANLADLIPAKPAKLSSTSGNWVFDFGAAQRVDLVALIHHNLDAGLSVKVEGNATDAWSSPSLSVAFTIPSLRNDGYPINPWLDLTDETGYTTTGYRYWRIVIVGTNSANVAIGEVVLIETKRLLEDVSWGPTVETERPIIEHLTDDGVDLQYDLGRTTRKFRGTVDATETNATAYEALLNDARIAAKPWLFVPDPSVNDAWFVKFDGQKYQRAYEFTDHNVMPLAVREVSRGLVL